MSQAPPPRERLLLVSTPNAVRLARLHTTDVLSRWGVHPDSVETIRLMVSELATNAVRHPKKENQQDSSDAQRHTLQTFEIALEIINDVVRVSVWDRDATTPVVQQVGLEAASGRGLSIVAAMKPAMGVLPRSQIAWESRVGRGTRSPGGGRPCRERGQQFGAPRRVDGGNG